MALTQNSKYLEVWQGFVGHINDRNQLVKNLSYFFNFEESMFQFVVILRQLMAC